MSEPRALRAKHEAFQLGIEYSNFAAAKRFLDELNYTGPVSLGVDDTKLLRSLRPSCQGEGYWILVGVVGAPPVFRTYEEMEAIVRELWTVKKHQIATKIRLYTMQVPLPKVYVIVIDSKMLRICI
jgi:hypothetical protein